MADELTVEQIKEYWTRQARTHGLSPAASWSDVEVLDLEVREIASRLSDGDKVLDVGCGNGYSTVQFAAQKQIAIRGIDYVAESIAQATARLGGLTAPLRGSAEFGVGDLTRLNEPPVYDKVISIRVMINLGAWEVQRASLQACGRATKPGGLLLISEATLQGWTKLNAFRAEWKLPPIPMPPFNNYLDEPRVVDALAPGFELVELVNFASTYFVATRVLKPLVAATLGDGAVDVADPTHHWNRWWAKLPAWGDYGTQKLFVFRKTA